MTQSKRTKKVHPRRRRQPNIRRLGSAAIELVQQAEQERAAQAAHRAQKRPPSGPPAGTP